MFSFFSQLEQRRNNESGINMVDLMMWLVIAALLLAAAIQGIGYYQKAAIVNNMQSDLDGVASRVMSTSAMADGKIDLEVVEEGAANAEWSADVSYSVESPSTGSKPYIRAMHPDISGMDVLYLFESCGDFSAGVHAIQRNSSNNLEECGVSAVPTNPGSALTKLSWETKPGVVSADWYGFASSDDGTKLIASKGTGDLYTSANSGESWTKRTPVGSTKNWHGVASSDDGIELIAGQDYGYVYTSKDGGDSWKQHTILGKSDRWYGMSSSADGTKLVAGQADGYLFVSTDGGENWEKKELAPGLGTWYSIDSSDDGKRVIAADSKSGYLFASTDYGNTWARLNGAVKNTWSRVASSSDGTMLTAAANSQYIYTSIDSGSTWKARPLAGTGTWYGLDSSDDGMKIAATTDGGNIRTSTDAGLTWSMNEGQGKHLWRGITVSGDGTKIFTGRYESGLIYSGTFGS